MSKNNLANYPLTSYSLYTKAHLKQTPKLTVVFLCISTILSPIQSLFADQTTLPPEVTTPVRQIDPTVLTDTFITEEPSIYLSDPLPPIETDTTDEVIDSPSATDIASVGVLPPISPEEIVSVDIMPPEALIDNNPLDLVTLDTDQTQNETVTEVPAEPFTQQNLTDSQVTFNINNCVDVGDGSFYCQHTNDTPLTDRSDGVYAYPDRDGDLEIYIQRNNELEQITHNQLDDASPWFDSLSNTIVWHRLVDGRYHIVSYDLATQVETQITTGGTNNMEPTRQDSYTAWQTWLDNNWEIVLYDGEEVFRISYSSEADLSPQLRNGLLLWHQLTAAGERRVFIYNIETKEQLMIEGEGDELITNARLMVVFDSQQSNGEVLVKGYDLVTGEIVPIAQQTNPLPEQIPDPNPVGEPTALFPSNNKTDITDDDEDRADDPLEDDQSNQTTSLLANDFDDETTLVLFDYGIASSTPTASELMHEADSDTTLTLDLRTPDPFEELTIAIPLYELPTTSTDSLSSSR